MRRIVTLLSHTAMTLLLTAMVFLTACNVHEWPEQSTEEALELLLEFETAMPQFEHYIDTRTGATIETKDVRDHGTMRYIVRAYPVNNDRVSSDYVHEQVFTRDVSPAGYDCTVSMSLSPGSYRLMVWAELSEMNSFPVFYDATDFGDITMPGEHRANTDYRDAFRGTLDVTLESSITEHAPVSGVVTMQRPLAKFEFITNDLVEFIEKETSRVRAKGDAKSGDDIESESSDVGASRMSLDDYRVVFYYVGFMPSEYSMYTDKPVDSKTGVFFQSTLRQLSDDEASLGFDYVFVNGTETAVAVRIAVIADDGTEVSLTDAIDVPLRRSHHTIVRGSFLLTSASGGVGIDPGFEGDHNVILP